MYDTDLIAGLLLLVVGYLWLACEVFGWPASKAEDAVKRRQVLDSPRDGSPGGTEER